MRKESELRARNFSFNYKDGEEQKQLHIKILEILDSTYGFYVWPCAPVLTNYIIQNANRIMNKNIVEIGCGTGLVGMIASKLGGNVIISDGSKFKQSLENAKENLKENGSENVEIMNIDWGVLDSRVLNLRSIDVILASDCFYDPKDFEPVLVTVSYLLRKNKGAEFWTTYQIRSSLRSIEHLLKKWRLKCRNVPLESFGHDDETIRLYIITHDG